MDNRIYIAIDLKSFYASVECVDRKLDPLKVNLVVADPNRTEKTICLAVSPALKTCGIGGRARLFEVVQKVSEINAIRQSKAPGRKFKGKSYFADELEKDKSLALDYIVAPPRMAHYMEVSTRIYNIYLKYVSSEDIHVYSIDEVFIDATSYLKANKLTPKEFTALIVQNILAETGITATAGIGTNMYLCKIAMDIVAKHMPADENGVRIAELDEMSYREQLWSHRPITDFWRVGKGYAKRLAERGLFTMGDIARCSVNNEDLLYKLFGINAELLIDHAWGWEPCTISEIKAYRPENNSISSGQVLQCPYDHEKAGVVIKEMADMLVLDLVDKGLVTDQIVLTVGYDIDNIHPYSDYKGEIITDHYGRKVPKSAHGSINLGGYTSSTLKILDAVSELYEKITDETLHVRRMYVVANHVIPESKVKQEKTEQLDFFTDYSAEEKRRAEEEKALMRERSMQKAMLAIKKKYGKNAVLKGMNFQEGATAIERNGQVGGHKA